MRVSSKHKKSSNILGVAAYKAAKTRGEKTYTHANTETQKAKRSNLPSFSSVSIYSACVATQVVVPLWPYSCLMPDPGAQLYRGGLAKRGVMD